MSLLGLGRNYRNVAMGGMRTMADNQTARDRANEGIKSGRKEARNSMMSQAAGMGMKYALGSMGAGAGAGAGASAGMMAGAPYMMMAPMIVSALGEDPNDIRNYNLAYFLSNLF